MSSRRLRSSGSLIGRATGGDGSAPGTERAELTRKRTWYGLAYTWASLPP